MNFRKSIRLSSLDSIRHIVDNKSLEREDVINYLDRLADTVLEFDSVTFHYYGKGNSKVPGLLFKKNFADGTLFSFDLVSNNKRSLVLQTLYMDSATYQKRKSAKTLPMQNANSNTSKTQVGQTSKDSITPTEPIVNTSDGRMFSLRNNAKTVDSYTKEQYNNFGWARYAEAISFNELEDLYSKIQEKGSLRRFKHSANGEAIIEVNNKPKTSLDVDNVFVFVTGTKNVPKITRVLRVALFNENDMEKVRKHIYAREQKYSNERTSAIVGNIYFEELVFEYRREYFGDYQEYRNEIGKQSGRSESEGDPGAYRDRDQREGTAYETESGITSNDEISYSLRNRTQAVALLERYEKGEITKYQNYRCNKVLLWQTFLFYLTMWAEMVGDAVDMDSKLYSEKSGFVQDNHSKSEVKSSEKSMFSFRNSKNGMANDALVPYNEEQTRFIKQRGDYIIDSFEKLKEVANLAFDQPDTKAIAHFGMVDVATLQKIKNSIPNLPKSMEMLFTDNRGYSIATTLDSIRHIVKEKRLSRQDVIEYLDRFADTVVEYDEVDFHYYTRRGRQTPGLLFRKDFTDGKYFSFDLVSQEKQSLLLQSLYLDRVDHEKRKSADPVLMQNAPASTPKARGGQTSKDSITQTEPIVNTSDGRMFSLRNNAKTVDNYTKEQYNNFGWARYAEAISFNELEDLYSKIQEKGSLRRFKHSANGEAIIEVNNKPKTSLDVDNVFVFVTGTKNVPKITRVLRASFYDQESMEIIREDIYANNSDRALKAYAQYLGKELVNYYSREDIPSFWEYKNDARTRSSRSESEGDSGAYRDWDQREGTAYETESGITSNDEISYSLRNRTKTVDSYTKEQYNNTKTQLSDPVYETIENRTSVEPTDFKLLKENRSRTNEQFGLTDDQARALNLYVSGVAYYINEKLNSGKTLDRDQAFVDRLIESLNKFPRFEGRTYRNLKFQNEQECNAFLGEHSVSNNVTVKSFTSTSKDPNGYPLFGKYVVHMVFDGVSGRDIADTYGIPKQQEVMFLPGDVYTVSRVSIANDGNPIIFVKEITNNEVQVVKRNTDARGRDVGSRTMGRGISARHEQGNGSRGIYIHDGGGTATVKTLGAEVLESESDIRPGQTGIRVNDSGDSDNSYSLRNRTQAVALLERYEKGEITKYQNYRCNKVLLWQTFLFYLRRAFVIICF